MYFDIKEEIERELDRIDQILEFTKGTGLIFVIDSNARSAVWHDTQTNKRGKTMEEYITSKSLYIMNEESERTMFHNRRGSTNIDLTIVNDQLLKGLNNWEI
jgi:sugar/nucleoside kinase (ribokinase family)